MVSPAAFAELPTTRKHLSFDPLIELVHGRAQELPDWRTGNVTFSMADAVMSAIAMFSLKDPALLAFEERRNDGNMINLYRINAVPSDTRMREILDPLDPDALRPMFNDVLRQLQRGKALKPFLFQDHYLLSIDGTGYFSSEECPLRFLHGEKEQQNRRGHVPPSNARSRIGAPRPEAGDPAGPRSHCQAGWRQQKRLRAKRFQAIADEDS